MTKNLEVLGICSVCKKIRIDNENNTWMSKENQPKLYERYIQKYEKKLTHSYCDPCYTKELSKI